MAKGYLYIKVDAESGPAFAQELDRKLAEGWRRHIEYEKRHRSAIRAEARSKEFYFYRRDEAPSQVACWLYILRRDAETLYVANIFPAESGVLTQGEYNGIQREFQKQVEKTGVPSLITGEKASLVLSANAQDKLMQFFRFANPSTGTTHPGDQRLRMEFLVTAHREGCFPDSHMFSDYIIETLRWEPKVVSQMAIEVEFAKGLLRVERETRDATAAKLRRA